MPPEATTRISRPVTESGGGVGRSQWIYMIIYDDIYDDIYMCTSGQGDGLALYNAIGSNGHMQSEFVDVFVDVLLTGYSQTKSKKRPIRN